jgi:hypothetical protein
MVERSGSVAVPEVAALRDLFAWLRSGLASPVETLADRVRAANRYTIYGFLTFIYGLGLRPRRDLAADLDRRMIDGWLLVSDKANRQYQDRRMVPICSSVVAMLEQSRLGLERLRTEFVDAFGTVSLLLSPPSPLAFAVASSPPHFELAMPAGVIARLHAEGGQARYPFPLTAQRHLWYSFSAASDVPLAVIEPFLGHHGPGLDWLAPTSLAHIPSKVSAFTALAENLLAAIGAIPIPRHPLVLG